MHYWFGVGILLATAGSLGAQALVEYTLGTARSAGSAAAIGKTTKSTEAVWVGTGKATDRAARPSRTGATRPAQAPRRGRDEVRALPRAAAARPSTPPAPVLPLPEPGQVAAGMHRRELFTKFAAPAMKATKMEGPLVLETYWYLASGRDTVVVMLRDGKVTNVASSSAN